jgi:hypothetical protein
VPAETNAVGTLDLDDADIKAAMEEWDAAMIGDDADEGSEV